MDDNQFWAHIWRTIAGAFILFVATIAGCVANTTYQTRIAIQSGSDPIKAACAMTSMSETNCVVATLQK